MSTDRHPQPLPRRLRGVPAEGGRTTAVGGGGDPAAAARRRPPHRHRPAPPDRPRRRHGRPAPTARVGGLLHATDAVKVGAVGGRPWTARGGCGGRMTHNATAGSRGGGGGASDATLRGRGKPRVAGALAATGVGTGAEQSNPLLFSTRNVHTPEGWREAQNEEPRNKRRERPSAVRNCQCDQQTLSTSSQLSRPIGREVVATVLYVYTCNPMRASESIRRCWRFHVREARV